MKITDGRFFNESEDLSGSPVVVLGYEIANNLFDNQDPIGKRVRLYGNKFTVIGVLEKEGASTFGPSKDESAFVPVNFIRRI